MDEHLVFKGRGSIEAALFDLAKAFRFATIGTVVWILIAYKFHQSMIDAVTGGHEVTRAEEPRLYNLLENLCISRGITMPKLKIADDDALNAFATGLNQKQYSITVTRGLINALNDAELEAVLGGRVGGAVDELAGHEAATPPVRADEELDPRLGGH